MSEYVELQEVAEEDVLQVEGNKPWRRADPARDRAALDNPSSEQVVLKNGPAEQRNHPLHEEAVQYLAAALDAMEGFIAEAPQGHAVARQMRGMMMTLEMYASLLESELLPE